MNIFSIAWTFDPQTSEEYSIAVVGIGPRGSNDVVEWPLLLKRQFRYPQKYGWQPSIGGASETLGLFGGKQEPRQEEVSECIERNIADLQTMCLSNLLETKALREWQNADAQSLLLLHGPVLPKAVGRFSSLRPPRALHIGWLSSPKPLPWLKGIPAQHLLTGPNALDAPERPWEEESLVVDHPFQHQKQSYCLHYLDLYRNRVVPKAILQTLSSMSVRPWMNAPAPVCLQISGLVFTCKFEKLINPYSAPLEFVARVHVTNPLANKERLLGEVSKRFMRAAKRKNLTDEEMEELIELIGQSYA